MNVNPTLIGPFFHYGYILLSFFFPFSFNKLIIWTVMHTFDFYKFNANITSYQLYHY